MTDPWLIVHRMQAWMRYHRLNAIHGASPRALQAAAARYAVYEGKGEQLQGADAVAYRREAGHRGYLNRGYRKAHALSPPAALFQGNHSDAKRKG